MNVTIQYEITNKGNETLYNVQVNSQQFSQAAGNINPGEIKRYTSSLYIPTDAEVQEDYGVNATVPNPFPIGGFNVQFNDAGGTKHTVTSNAIEIKLA